MSSFKKLNQQDVYITSYVAKKSWNTSGINKREEGIYFLPFSKNATVQDCALKLTATLQRIITSDCTLELTSTFQRYIDHTPTPTPTNTPTPTPTNTPTPTPTSTPTPTPVDCALVLSGVHISYRI